jgi:hypothetical protein
MSMNYRGEVTGLGDELKLHCVGQNTEERNWMKKEKKEQNSKGLINYEHCDECWASWNQPQKGST